MKTIQKIVLEKVPRTAEKNTMYIFPPLNFKQEVYNERTGRNEGWFFPGLQSEIQKSKIAIVGSGGIGGHMDDSLLRLGVGKIVIADSGIFDVSNIHRQFGARIDTVGKSKALETARILRKTIADAEITVFTEGSNPDTVYHILEGTNLVIDSIEYHRIGARYELLQRAQELGVPVMNGNSVGFGTRLFYFPNKKGAQAPSFADALPFDKAYAYMLEDKIANGTATQKEYEFCCEVVNSVFLPHIPNYGGAKFNTREAFLHRLLKERIASIISTNPKMAAGVLADHVPLFFARKFGIYEGIDPQLEFPEYFFLDIAQDGDRRRMLNLKNIRHELDKHMPR